MDAHPDDPARAGHRVHWDGFQALYLALYGVDVAGVGHCYDWLPDVVCEHGNVVESGVVALEERVVRLSTGNGFVWVVLVVLNFLFVGLHELTGEFADVPGAEAVHGSDGRAGGLVDRMGCFHRASQIACEDVGDSFVGQEVAGLLGILVTLFVEWGV